MGEADPSIKIAKFVLPILVYIPITVVTAIFLLFFGTKFLKIIRTPGGVGNLFKPFMSVFFKFKNILKDLEEQFWPDEKTNLGNEKRCVNL